jgi:chromosomal replication initiator protein
MIAGRRIISIAQVQDAVARAFHLSRADLLSRTRRQHVVYARHVAMFLSRELAGKVNDGDKLTPRRSASFHRIGKAFCRDHSSVIHACNVIGRRQRQDTGFAELLRNLAREVSNRAGGGSWGVSNGVTSATSERRMPADELS